MEAASLVIGIPTLTGLFNNAIDCFEYVQLGRSLGTKFHTTQLRLDIARLRLSRWGVSIGLNDDLSNVETLQTASLPVEDLKKAGEIVGQILKLFEDAEKVSGKFKYNGNTNTEDSSVMEIRELDPETRTLHESMHNLALKRQNSTGLGQKFKWAIWEEKHFDKLMEDIERLTDILIEVFPSAKTQQKKLCEAEVFEIKHKGALPVLKDIAASQDKVLEAAITEAQTTGLQSTGTATWNNYNSKVGKQVGTEHIYGGQTITL